MSRYIACIEVRPLLSGIWICEDCRVVYEGEIVVTFDHPNPLVRSHPRRFRIPIIYAMHVSTFYTYHGSSPTRPARLSNSFQFEPTRSYPFSLRVIREETSPSISRSPIKVTFSSDLVPSGRVITPSNKIKEDPVEYESGSELVV